MATIVKRRRAVLLGIIVTSLLLAQLPVDAQTRRAGANRGTPAVTPQAPAKPAAPDKAAATILSSLKSKHLGAAFESGKLPEPLRRPQGNEDEVAAALAKHVSARNEQSLPALVAAILAAGFAVRDPDGSLTQTVEPGQGLTFEAWEVAAMAKMYGEGKTATLTYLTDGLKLIPELKRAPLNKILVDGIRGHAQSDHPSLRLWARLIVELGRHSDQPYDMLTETNESSIRLDAIQSALILRRLAGDFYGRAERSKQGSSRFGSEKLRPVTARYITSDAGQFRSPFIRVAYRGDSYAPFFKNGGMNFGSHSLQGGPCSELGKGDTSIILDAGAVITSTGWGALLDHLEAVKSAAVLNIANILLAYAKFIATYAALETEITVEDPPLVRTTNSSPGSHRRLTAKVTMNVGKWENVNCIRTALNVATGIDFSLLSDGPLEDVEVNWKLDEGGGGDFYSNSGGVTGKRQIVGFWNGGPRIQDAGTYAGASGKPGVAVGNLTRVKTDKEGLARVFLQGSPQVPYVAPPMLPVMKQAVVRTTIKLKGGDIKGDAVDVAGQALGGVGALITLPLELLYRTDWASTATLVVPVKDWEECERGWYGTITVTGKLNQTTDEMPGGARGWSLSRVREVIKDFQYKFVLNGVKDKSQGFQNGYFADAQLKVDNSNIVIEKNREGGFCDTGRRDARGSKITEKVEGINTQTHTLLLKGSGTVRTTVYVAERGAEGYNILIETIPPISGKTLSKTEVHFPQCPLWERVNSSPADEQEQEMHFPRIEFLAAFDPKNPGVVSGTRVVRDERTGGTITYQWELQVCQ
jgi:hypothetical protein